MRKAALKKYCTGCGACVSAGKATFTVHKRGFTIPDNEREDFKLFCNKVCFSNGKQYGGKSSGYLWGNIVSYKLAWSSLPLVRLHGSSGGTLTSLCIYLLKEGIVDGIIHVKEDENSPIGSVVTCSTTEAQVVAHSGSRYSSSAPLIDIFDYLQEGRKYAFVGKPCDVATLQNLKSYDERFEKNFVLLLSFFCAGVPSNHANALLLKKMGTSVSNCKSLRYRGDGWPGYATAEDFQGKKYRLDYRSAWRDTLGRDIRPICRFCIDGIGEMADIVCYDAWYKGNNNNPIFSEADGRNGVLCRTAKGNGIFKDAVNKGYLKCEDYEACLLDLPHIQRYQFIRRSTMPSSIIAMRMMLKHTPSYPLLFMFKQMRNSSLRTHITRLCGTIKRVVQRKI